MNEQLEVTNQVRTILSELAQACGLTAGKLLVLGTSTSEVAGKHIGTGGAMEVAEAIYNGVRDVQEKLGFDLAVQCCEHLNRALVVDRKLLQVYRSMGEEVAAVPVPKAGGSMGAYYYGQLKAPCLVEHIQADAAMDIGNTLIGMHMKRVAVPFRPSIRQVGGAHVTAAFARPKLIGGARAVYAPLMNHQADPSCD
ncbi:TIGR01440 family protein [Marinicrinis sediminis]|uniref:UPF0340 protein ACFSUC_10725 n=1 Tax=Marinicrinis sediminis TaxID=1652465 RepID=A0ABW5RAN4_9BACL